MNMFICDFVDCVPLLHFCYLNLASSMLGSRQVQRIFIAHMTNWPYLTNETRHEQQHQNAVMVPPWPKEAVRHEGCQQRHVPVGLGYLHLSQLHFNCL